MRRMVTHAIVTTLTVAALALPVGAQQQRSTITLSCNGTSKLTATAAADLKPDPITNLGIIVNFADRTVRFMDYVVPITGVAETLVSFNGRQEPVFAGIRSPSFVIDGAIDRVTGHATIDWWHASVGNNTSWQLTCRPATRQF
jgi:hypothetical protein